jgi:hypothetical protein
MAVARSKIVNPQITPWYHCISRCVRGTDLLSDERKLWIQQRLEELVGIFAIDVAGFSRTETHWGPPLRRFSSFRGGLSKPWPELRSACPRVGGSGRFRPAGHRLA